MAELGQLSYSIILDDKNFSKQATDVVKKLKTVNAEIEGLLSIDSDKIAKPFNLAGMSIEKMVTQAKVLETAFKALSQSGTGELTQDAVNLKLRWQEIQTEVSKYGLNLKSSLMEQQKIIEPLKSLKQVLEMPTNSLDEVAAKLSEIRRVRAEQVKTDANYVSTMSMLNKVESELLANQKSAIAIGKSKLSVEQQLAAELQKQPIAINDIIASAKQLEVLYKSLSDRESELGGQAQAKWLGMREQLQAYGYTIKSSVMEQQTLTGALAMQENTIGQVESKMKALSAVRKNIDVSDKTNLETLKRINDEYMRLGDHLKKVGARQYNLADLARNTNGAFSPLGFSIQQVARELPSLTMGAQMFFLAISNNLPILSDELRKAKESYKALTAEGKAAIPVWKQVVSSIFSWQTAMVVGITLLTMYGRELGNFIKGLFGANSASEKLTKSILEQHSAMNAETLEVTRLFDKLKAVGKETNEYREIKDKIISKYGEYLKGLNSEVVALNNIEGAYNAVISAIKEKARVQALDKATSEAAAEYETKKTNSLIKIRKDYIDKFGEEKGGELFRQLRDEIEKTGEVSEKTKKIIEDSFSSIVTVGGSNTGASQSVKQNGVLLLVDNITTANKELKKSIEEVNAVIGDMFSENSETTKSLIKDAENALKEAQLMPSETKKQIADRNLAIKKAQDKLNYLNTYGVPKEPTKTPAIQNQQEKFTQEQVRAAEDLETEIAKKRIEAQEDGFEKRISLMKLNHSVELREIRRQREDMLREVIENERKLFEANPKNKDRKFDSSGVTLSTSQENLFAESITETEKKQNKELSEEYAKAIEQYKTYAAARLDTIKKYESDRKAVIAAGGSQENLNEVDRQEKEALSAIDKQFAMKEESYKQWVDSISGMAIDQLNELLRQVELTLGMTQISLAGENDPSRNTQQVAVLRQQIVDLKKQIDTERNKANQRENKANDAGKSIKDWKRLDKVLGDVSKSFKEIGEEVGGTSGKILALSGEITSSAGKLINDIVTLSDMSVNGITTTATAAETAIQALERASVILTIIATGIQLLQKLQSVTKDAYARYEKFDAKVEQINDLKDAVNQYELAVLRATQAEKNWFGEDNLRNLKDYKDQQIKVHDNYFKKLYELQAKYQNKKGGGWLTGSLNYGLLGGIDWAIGTDILGNKYDERLEKAINNLRIETRKRKSGFLGSGIGSKSQKTEDLRTWVRRELKAELFDEDGWINQEVYAEIMDKFSGKLVGQTKETLEELSKLKEQYDEYLNQLRDYVNSLYEPLVDNMVDSLWDWLNDGKDALDSFKGYASDTFKDIVSDMLRTIVLRDVVGSFQEDIANAYEAYSKGDLTEAELSKIIADRTAELTAKYESSIPALQTALESMTGAFEQAGFDFSSETERTGLSGSLARASQDSIDELTGVMYAGLEKLSQTANNTNAININITAMSAELKTQTTLLRSIDGYTARLPYIETGINTIINRGVKLQ